MSMHNYLQKMKTKCFLSSLMYKICIMIENIDKEIVGVVNANKVNKWLFGIGSKVI